jgi:hypothetical protein
MTINLSSRKEKVTLQTTDSYKGNSTKTGVAGGDNGVLTYNIHWKMPK